MAGVDEARWLGRRADVPSSDSASDDALEGGSVELPDPDARGEETELTLEAEDSESALGRFLSFPTPSSTQEAQRQGFGPGLKPVRLFPYRSSTPASTQAGGQTLMPWTSTTSDAQAL